MDSPHSVELPAPTEARLGEFVARHPGLTDSSAIALLVEEGLRMDVHPAVVFRASTTGRRAALAGGPDVWEVVRSIALTRLDNPELDSAAIITLTAGLTGIPEQQLTVAVAYYDDYPTEVDDEIAEALAIEREWTPKR